MRHSHQFVRAACLAGAAIAVTLAAPAAAAQAEAGIAYDLPAQPLADTLRAIARLSGREILFEAANVEGRRAPPLKGQLTPQQALGAALAGSGLVVEERAGAFLVRRADPAPEAPQANAEASSITVTGTRIRGGDSPSPIIVTTRRQLEEAGVTDLAGFTRVLPQNYTGGVNPGIAGGGEQGGQSNINNSAALNLRGLGPDATLTLINGHRVAYDALFQGIDISPIPLGAVERIDVMAEGASALYGSDAVGGVANIVLRRDYSGLEATARIGASTDGGNFQQQYSVVTGHRWSSGGVMAAFDYNRTGAIFAGQRDYTRTLDPSLTLTMRSRQLSAVLAGHQKLTEGISLDLDGYLTDRHSLKQTPFSPDQSAYYYGLVGHPALLSWAVTPTLRAALPGGWTGSLSATRAFSRTTLNQQVYIGGTARPIRVIYENRMTAVEAGVEGPLFRLPGGEARVAAGGGYRGLILEANGGGITALTFNQSRNVAFAYGELSLPLIGPEVGAPLLHRLTFTAAARYEKYRGLAGVTTPKLGLVYQPHPDMTIRAAWGRSFKAPTLYQLNQVLEGALLPGYYFDPQPSPPLPDGSTVLLIGGGNPNLRPERATTRSATFEVRPKAVPGLHLEADYFKIRYSDRIGTPIPDSFSALPNPLYKDYIVFNPSAAQVNAIVATLPLGLSNQSGGPFDPANVRAIVDEALRNISRVGAQGVDLQADYRIDLSRSSRVLLSAVASYLESEQQAAPGQPVLPQAGTLFNPPHWRGRAGASWQGARAGLAAYVNYVGGTRDTRYPDGRGPGPFVTLDLSAAVRTGTTGPWRNLELRLSALNILNEKPDIIRDSEPQAPSYDSTNQSPIGRFLGLSIRKAW
jgi:iron complex outermembrane receptor protein